MRSRRPNAHLLSPEVWGRICIYLHKTPRKVFMLLCAVKDLDYWLNDDWWEAYWNLHQQYNISRSVYQHWYLRTDVLGMLRPPMYKPILRLVYGLFCNCCGRRYNHQIIHQMKMRICAECRQEQYISNAVLYFEYGISFSDLIDRWQLFLRYLPVHDYRPSEIATLSRNAIDVMPSCTREVVFFWLPDLKSLFDMPALRVQQTERVAKINLLKAVFKRAYASKLLPRHKVEALHANELKRIKKPLLPATWFVGGLQKLGWRCTRNTENASIPVVNTWRRLKVTLRMHRPVPILGKMEFVLKTAISKFKLDLESLEANRSRWESPSDHVFPFVPRILSVADAPRLE